MLDQELLKRFEAKEVDAIIDVAYAYFHGENVEQDDEKAFQLFNEAYSLDPTQADVCCSIGTCLFFGFGTSIDKEKAVDYWERARDLNDHTAYMWLGMLYRDGDVYPQDTSKAISYLEKAIELGNVRASVELGDIYYTGELVTGDTTKAVELYRHAAEEGNLAGQSKLALALENGIGTEKNIDEALQWFIKAGDNGSDACYVEAGNICQEQGNSDDAIMYYKKAMEMGNRNGAFLLGAYYGKRNQLHEAYECFKRGYELKDVTCAFYLGRMYYGENAVVNDPEKAVECLAFAADNGFAPAAYELATIYKAGDIVPKNDTLQYNYLVQAYENGHDGACYMLAECYESGVGTKKDMAKAIECLEKGITYNNPVVQAYCHAKLGDIFRNGLGCSRDIQKAIGHYEIAAEKKHLGSIMALGSIYANMGHDTEEFYNRELAEHYYEEAATNGVINAPTAIGILNMGLEDNNPNPNKAVHYLKRGRELGDAKAQAMLNLAFGMFDLDKLDINIREEISHVIDDAEAGDPVAQYAMYGLMLKEQDSSISECQSWLEKAARGGHHRALDNYAKLWAGDLIQDLDYDMFIAGCNKAIANGTILSTNAKYALGQSYLHTTGSNRSISSAKKYLIEAAEEGLTVAMRVVGHEYDTDGAFGNNPSEALKYYEKAIATDGDIPSRFLAAIIYYEKQDYSRSAEYFRIVIDSNDRDLSEKSRELLAEVERTMNQQASGSQFQTSSTSNHSSSSSGGKKSGCYIATAVYGSYDCPEVWTLRRFRDECLARTARGRAFIKVYYALSPKLVKTLGNTKLFNRFWRGRLDKLVGKLKTKGYSDTPYKD